MIDRLKPIETLFNIWLKPNETLFNIGLQQNVLSIASPTSIFLMLGFSLPIGIFKARLKQKCVIYIKPSLYIFHVGFSPTDRLIVQRL